MNSEFLENSTILIVDDNPDNLDILFDFLSEEGFEILVARSGESALEKAEYAAPDLILLDVMMPPGIDGFETCISLKSNPNTKDIPVIFMTALSDVEHKVKGLQAGAVDYITKPIQHEEVLVRVRIHLKLKNLVRLYDRQNIALKAEVSERIVAQSALQKLTTELEQKVWERTSELTQTLTELQTVQEQLLAREQRLIYTACHDALTELPNRFYFIERLIQIIAIAQGNPDYLYAVLFIDLERFRLVNDTLGNFIGDQLLKSVAHRTKNCLRPQDTIARFGGDDFMVLLESITNIEEVIAIVERIQSQLRQPFTLEGYEVLTDSNIGLTISSIGYERTEDILTDIDTAMYHAKANGKGSYAIFTPAMKTQAKERLQIEADLKRAIVDQNFILYYQPIIDLATNEISGFEALVRLQNHTNEIISPNKFIPVAEDTGLIKEIGWWIMEEACRQISVWQKTLLPHLMVTINLSAIQLHQVGFVERLRAILQQFCLPEPSIKLEITESCLIDPFSQEIKILRQLQNSGIKLCIDDFGTGYSSLSCLHEFPIDTLKIDRSFVKRIGRITGDAEIVQTIITLAHRLGMDVVAEGIETTNQLRLLTNLGCEMGQGYLFARPLPAADATKFVQNWRSL
ncbi:diguanylate cyclase (GGDEF) domain-containing protein [Synechococcus sp. PCC 7502]|uniref:two-component system response regulator n=1 Tax=Synechococcus sp. PCC 7502 TaxID=1173263 RepID=UPI00029FA5C6|nr:EAL domain-containing response regulator [Synechococcus sp. PCC 7502]AFY73080.1 diguanylate cyclase (GGDEF) domain-containing protein [Synechococcus sp. PCC 7502]